ncbi:zinc knuckle protein [Trichinella spiralis]|uniref:zinc knuckle protein n=1 Tax=Trichinella spiralis TaxID=6334 RepID=UPI0001EFE75B|nr:zinc knuckle protein [Trichinella spiralis]
MATRYRLCFYCLKPGHVSSACKSDRRKKSPASKDSSAVVSVGTTTTERVQETPTVECKSSSVSMIHANLASEKRGKINRFQTIKARAFSDTGSGITVTCLLDTGADSQVVQLWLGRLDGSQNAERYPLEALTVPSLCHRIPVSKILTSEWEHLQFFDPVIDDESSDEVHVVIGIDYYYRFLGDAIRRGKPGDPVAVETVLGWIIFGPVNPHPAPETVAAFNAVVELSVENLLRRFLEIEEMGVPFRSESDEVDPEKRFREGLSYDGTRYSVRLLWKNSWLPDNFAVAKRCLETLERRMAREPSRRDVHSSILHNYLVNGWAEEITSEGPHGRTWYLPHHVVSQQGPEAMKHRIVFVASVKFKGTSLKEQLDSGLKLQADLLGILLRFRRFRVALQSDLAKMFLQVGLFDEDRGVCRFLWRKDGLGGPIATYRLTRVCFSVACSPYVAMQVVNHHLREKRDCFGTVVDEIKVGMYVDDLVVSCDSIDEARDFAHRSSELLASGGFHLAKWANNAPEALVDLPAEEIFRDRYSCLWKNLGISWNPQEDELTFRPPELAANQDQETKRNLLRTATSVFDPLGGLTPFTVRAKRMFQSLWQTGMTWDDNLPAEVFSPTEASRLELYGFGDASEAAYAAVVYLRAVKTPDDVQSGSAEEVEHSTARADGCSSLCPTGLLREKRAGVGRGGLPCWSDSKVALGWINGDKSFVANRVREIQVLTLSLWWRYIPTEDNPADLASGGCTVKNLSTSLKWWQGPTWLRGPPETWPEAEREERIESLELLEKERRATAVLVTVSPSQDAANVINLGTGLTSDELKEAERVWIRQEQIHAFGLKESLDKAMTKMLCGLNPFLDEFGVLQVGGRLGRAQLEEETKFPALLPRKGMIVDLLIRREHNRQLHAGVAQTLTALRERFWILRGRSAVKRVIRTCGICQRLAARPF